MTLYETISRLAQQIENGALTGEREKELLIALEEWLYSDAPCGPREDIKTHTTEDCNPEPVANHIK